MRHERTGSHGSATDGAEPRAWTDVPGSGARTARIDSSARLATVLAVGGAAWALLTLPLVATGWS
ncbi:hypothetical protein [Cellulomonas dongxiuzhuiae]|uniref:Uncharacterized protein n=1 Tax=Cellulomonas dongxiuzhuiae TaxID=2819979 RepID=A0ABX8GIN9_9CELL|nr:hypothetical protein [Cellulomonas dongxiuzhuiae]MBO3094700.1 hypothetical protein [Cellulomonas dongxiuzhuiae]QWC15703.1 hypothetical protein KKR89_15690 [Cellulomonas dongxiuzhuiae]